MIPINRNGNCEDDMPGTGVRLCDIADFGDISSFDLHPKRWKMNSNTDEITDASWRALIKSGDVRPFTDIYDFTQDTPENERSTSSTGKLNKLRNGKPQFSFMFTKGGCFHKTLYAHATNSKWDISLNFENGKLMAISEDGNDVKGFDMGMFDVETFKLQQGGDPQSSTAVLQLLNARQFNQGWVFIKWSELGVDLSNVDGVYNASITYDETPVAGDTEVVVNVASACNLSDNILGAEAATDWALGGVQATTRTVITSVYDAEAGTYTLTLSGALAEGDTIRPRLTSAAGDNVFEDDLGNMFKGQARLITIAEATT